jgi:hypothetical protein
MEPNNQNSNDPQKPLPPQDRPTYADLHAEGVDIVANSGISEANEFTMAETNSAAESAMRELEKHEAAAETPSQKTLTPEQATKISNLQEIPRKELPVPIKPKEAPQPEPVRAKVMPPPPVAEKPRISEVKNDPSIKQIRTFKTDAEEAVRYHNVSAVDIAVAEQKKKEATPVEYVHDEASHTRLGAFIFAVIAIILALSAGWYYWFTSSQKTATEIQTPVSKDKIIRLIPYKTGSSMVLDNRENAIDLIAERLDTLRAATGTVYALLPKASEEDAEGVPLNTIFLDTSIPESLLRSFSGEYMIGAYMTPQNEPFMIIKTSSFPIAFAGMLEWEKSMVKDLLPLIEVAHPNGTGTSTKAFEDSVFMNIDVRVVRDETDAIILAYTLPNKDTLVIATGESSLRHILNEILKVRTIQ